MAPPLFPDETLPPRTIGLEEFVQLAEEYSNDEDIDRFINFVLAGRAPNSNPNSPYDQRRLFINPRYDDEFPEHYTILGDFDSVIGLTRLLPFSDAITWHLFPPFSETLTNSVHIKWPIVRNNGTLQVPLHKIPNCLCFKFGTRHQGRLFFPKRYDPHASPTLDHDVLASMYDYAILPALKAVAPELAVQWPVSFDHVSHLVRGANGQFGTLTKDITQMFLEDFARELLNRLADLGPSFEDAFFEIEAKGVKATSAHNPEDPIARQEALAAVLHPIDQYLIPRDELEARWFVDVALEVHAEGRVMQWLTESHSRLIQHILPSITEDQAIALKHSNAFKEDLSGHLTALSGFRLEPGRRGRADHVSYINIYTTDKSATYQQHNGAYKRRTGQDLLPGPFKNFIRDVDTVTNTFAECAGFNGVVQNGAARMEARVGLLHAEDALTTLPNDLVTESIHAVDSAMWWYFKFFRASALYRLFQELASSPPDARAWTPSLMLGAICVYMFNAVIYRPSEKRIEAELSRQCAFWVHPRVHPYEADYADADFENVNLVPCTLDRGLYFLSGFVRDETHGILRLPAIRQIDREELAILYKKPNLHDVAKAFGGRSFGLSILSRSHKDRTSTRRATVPVQALRGQLTLHDFALTQRGVARIPTMQMTGPDIEDVDDPDDQPATLDRTFSLIWAQFPSDVIQCSPNVKNRHEPSHVKMSQAQREAVTHDLYRSLELPFDAAYLRLCTPAQWRELVFDKFFPPKGTQISDRIQNFRNAKYFDSYMREINALSDRDATVIREELWALFRGISWLPHPHSDRMWTSKAMRSLPKGWRALPPDHHHTSVHIAINASKCPDPDAIFLLGTPNPHPEPAEPEDEEEAAWVELAQRLQTLNSLTQGESHLDLGGSVGPLLDRIRRLPGGESAYERGRSPSIAGSSVSQAGGGRRGTAYRREEEEESSSAVEVGRGIRDPPVDVFSIGLTRSQSVWSRGPTASPPLMFPSSPELVESVLFDELEELDVPWSLQSSPGRAPGRKRRRLNRDPFERFDLYSDGE